MHNEELTKQIKNQIDKHKDKYIIFYSDWCTYSQNALKLLRDKKLKYRRCEIENIDGNLNALLTSLANIKSINFDVSHTTRPIIIKNGKFIGGYSELAKLVS